MASIITLSLRTKQNQGGKWRPGELGALAASASRMPCSATLRPPSKRRSSSKQTLGGGGVRHDLPPPRAATAARRRGALAMARTARRVVDAHSQRRLALTDRGENLQGARASKFDRP